MGRHRKTRKTHEVLYATTYIHNIAHEQLKHLSDMRSEVFLTDDYDKWIKYRQDHAAALDRWIYAPDRWHNCPSHKMTKETKLEHKAFFINALLGGNKPDTWSDLQWHSYLLTLWSKEF